MKIDLTCPVELWQYAMPTETASECTFILNNLNEKVVVSVQATLSCYDASDELLFRQTERVQGLKAAPGERFSMVILPTEWDGVEGMDLVIEKVWFDDATVWRKGNAPLTHYQPNALPTGRALDELRFVAGKDAAGYPQVQEEVWLCVCGRANALDSQRCCRCERRRDAVFASFSRENVGHVIAAHEQKLAQAARKAREDNNLLQENQEKRRAAKRRRRKQAVRIGTTLAVVAAAAVIAVVWLVPTLRYNTAADLLADGHYDQASAAFSAMGDYRDAMTQVLECDYQKAKSLHEAGGEENLSQAEELFLSLEDYADSADQANRTAYDLGLFALADENYDLAAEKFQQLGDYLDSAEQLDLTVYRQADSLLADQNYEAARVLFEGLNNYQDSAEKTRECSYQLAKTVFDEGLYDQAIEQFAPLAGYADTDELIKQAWYQLAELDASEGETEQAGERYLLAWDYSDAADKANVCFYDLALQHKEAGEFEEAMKLFLRVPEYEDSFDQAQQCIYEQAAQLMTEGDYANASALLETICTYEDAQDLLDECLFRLAQDALNAGEAEQAERYLSGIAEYKGSEAELRKVRYQLAENAFNNGEYQKALERYELLDGYKNSTARIRQCRYALAEEAMNRADYDTAAVLYATLGSYKQSASLLKEALYQRALGLKEKGEISAAIVAFSEIDSKQAREALKELRMQWGAQLEADGRYEQALAQYDAVKDDKLAAERANACRYLLAVERRDEGDYTGAAEAFHQLGQYEDAQAQRDACYASYFGDNADAARQAAKANDQDAVIRALYGFDLNVLGKTYSDLAELYAEACFQKAEQLYREGSPYEAIPYYQAAGEKRTENKLNRRTYLILGVWQSATEKTAEFRTDGTCDLLGETLYFRVSNFSLYTGTDPESMAVTHKISVLDKNGMSLRDLRNGGDVLYKFSREGDGALPPMTVPEPEAEEDVVPVAEENDADA